jgi:hypothetical protein
MLNFENESDQELESQGEGVGNHEIPDTDTDNDSRPMFYDDAYEVELSQASKVGSDVDSQFKTSELILTGNY